MSNNLTSPGREARLDAVAQLLRSVEAGKQQQQPAAVRPVSGFVSSTKWVEQEPMLPFRHDTSAAAAASARTPASAISHRSSRSNTPTWSDIDAVVANEQALDHPHRRVQQQQQQPTSAATAVTMGRKSSDTIVNLLDVDVSEIERRRNNVQRPSRNDILFASSSSPHQQPPAAPLAAALEFASATRDSGVSARGNTNNQTFGSLAAHKRRMAEAELRQMQYEDVLLKKSSSRNATPQPQPAAPKQQQQQQQQQTPPASASSRNTSSNNNVSDLQKEALRQQIRDDELESKKMQQHIESLEEEMRLLRLRSKIGGQHPFLTSTGDIDSVSTFNSPRGAALLSSSSSSRALPPTRTAMPRSPPQQRQQLQQQQRRAISPQHDAMLRAKAASSRRHTDPDSFAKATNNHDSFARFVPSSSDPRDRSAHLTLVPGPAAAYESQDHRSLLHELAHEPSMFPHNAHNHVDESGDFSNFSNSNNNQILREREQIRQQLAREDHHRIHGLNDSAAFAAQSRAAAKQESFRSDQFHPNQNNILRGQQSQHSLAGAPLVPSRLGDDETSDPLLRQVAPDLARAQRDFAARAQHVRQRVTETRVVMALRAVVDWEQRERLIVRVAEAIERGTYSLLVRHLANRARMLEDETEERFGLYRAAAVNVQFVAKRVRLRKDEVEVRKKIQAEREEQVVELNKRMQRGAAAFKAMLQLVLHDEPAARRQLQNEAGESIKFLVLRSCELMEEQHRAFLLTGAWCGTEEMLFQVKEDFDLFFESASQRRVRSTISRVGAGSGRSGRGGAGGGWAGPSIPVKGQFALDSDVVDAASDRVMYVRAQHAAARRDEFFEERRRQQQQQQNFVDPRSGLPVSPPPPGQQSQTNRPPPPFAGGKRSAAGEYGFVPPGAGLTDGEVIFAQLSRAAKCLADYHNPPRQQQHSQQQRPLPMSPAVGGGTGGLNNSGSSISSSAFPSDRQANVAALYSPAEQARRVALSSHLVALRRGDDIVQDGVSLNSIMSRKLAGSTAYDENSATVLSSSAPDNFIPGMYQQAARNKKKQQQERQQQQQQDDDEQQQQQDEGVFSLMHLDGLTLAVDAVLAWNGWLPVSVYFSVIVPYARLLRDESVSRLALMEGEEFKLQAIIGQKALDIGNKMTRALATHSANAAERLASPRTARRVQVRHFGPPAGGSGSTMEQNGQHNMTTSALKHDLKLFRLADPGKQGFVSLPSVTAVLRSSPDLVGMGRDVFEVLTLEDITAIFRDVQDEEDSNEYDDVGVSEDSSRLCLTFPEFREFLQTLRQVMSLET